MIQLLFDKETEQYVRLMCTRKGITLEGYIIDNFEWDDKPECLSDGVLLKIPKRMCRDCEYSDRCPDSKHSSKEASGDETSRETLL